jgi:hypothetical protein
MLSFSTSVDAAQSPAFHRSRCTVCLEPENRLANQNQSSHSPPSAIYHDARDTERPRPFIAIKPPKDDDEVAKGNGQTHQPAKLLQS